MTEQKQDQERPKLLESPVEVLQRITSFLELDDVVRLLYLSGCIGLALKSNALGGVEVVNVAKRSASKALLAQSPSSSLPGAFLLSRITRLVVESDTTLPQNAKTIQEASGWMQWMPVGVKEVRLRMPCPHLPFSRPLRADDAPFTRQACSVQGYTAMSLKERFPELRVLVLKGLRVSNREMLGSGFADWTPPMFPLFLASLPASLSLLLLPDYMDIPSHLDLLPILPAHWSIDVKNQSDLDLDCLSLPPSLLPPPSLPSDSTSSNGISDVLSNRLDAYAGLEQLQLREMPLSGEPMPLLEALLQRITHLRKLSILWRVALGNQGSNQCFNARLPSSLAALHLSSDTVDNLPALLATLPNLMSLKLSIDKKLEMREFPPNLTKFVLLNVFRVTMDDDADFITYCPFPTTLQCLNLRTRRVQLIDITKCEKLQDLHVESTKCLRTDPQLPLWIPSNLRHFTIGHNEDYISLEDMERLPKSLTHFSGSVHLSNKAALVAFLDGLDAWSMKAVEEKMRQRYAPQIAKESKKFKIRRLSLESGLFGDPAPTPILHHAIYKHLGSLKSYQDEAEMQGLQTLASMPVLPLPASLLPRTLTSIHTSSLNLLMALMTPNTPSSLTSLRLYVHRKPYSGLYYRRANLLRAADEKVKALTPQDPNEVRSINASNLAEALQDQNKAFPQTLTHLALVGPGCGDLDAQREVLKRLKRLLDLKKVEVASVKEQGGAEMLRFIDCPSLTHLHLHFDSNYGEMGVGKGGIVGPSSSDVRQIMVLPKSLCEVQLDLASASLSYQQDLIAQLTVASKKKEESSKKEGQEQQVGRSKRDAKAFVLLPLLTTLHLTAPHRSLAESLCYHLTPTLTSVYIQFPLVLEEQIEIELEATWLPLLRTLSLRDCHLHAAHFLPRLPSLASYQLRTIIVDQTLTDVAWRGEGPAPPSSSPSTSSSLPPDSSTPLTPTPLASHAPLVPVSELTELDEAILEERCKAYFLPPSPPTLGPHDEDLSTEFKIDRSSKQNTDMIMSVIAQMPRLVRLEMEDLFILPSPALLPPSLTHLHLAMHHITTDALSQLPSGLLRLKVIQMGAEAEDKAPRPSVDDLFDVLDTTGVAFESELPLSPPDTSKTATKALFECLPRGLERLEWLRTIAWSPPRLSPLDDAPSSLSPSEEPSLLFLSLPPNLVYLDIPAIKCTEGLLVELPYLSSLSALQILVLSPPPRRSRSINEDDTLHHLRTTLHNRQRELLPSTLRYLHVDDAFHYRNILKEVPPKPRRRRMWS